MFFKKRKISNTPYAEMSLLDLIKQFIISKLPKQKTKLSKESLAPQQTLPSDQITYIAIVLDGVVEDVMRAQNRLAALLLSGPDFIEFDPTKDKPQIGETQYKNNKFVYPEKELMTDKEISALLDKESLGKNNED